MQKLKSVIPLFLILFSCFATTKAFALKIRYTYFSSFNGNFTLACDSTDSIGVRVAYIKEEGDAYPFHAKISIFDIPDSANKRNLSGSDILGGGTLTVDLSDPDTGTIDVYIQLKCNAQNPNGKCFLSGNYDTSHHHSPHILISYPNFSAPPNVLNCRKPNKAYAYIVPKGKGYLCELDSLPITISSPVDSLGGGHLKVTYDSNYFRLVNAYFISAFSPGIAEGTIDTSLHGVVNYTFTFMSPQIIDTNGMQMGSIVLQPKTTTPFGRYLVDIDSSSEFVSPSLTFVDAALGSEYIVAIPCDNTPPVVNCSMITSTPTSLTGSAGAIFDDFISTPDYVVTELYKIDIGNVDTAWEGGLDTVHTDGSFTIPDIIVNNNDTLLLMAYDGAGNVGYCKWVAQVSAVPGISNNNNKIKVYPTLMNDKLQVSSSYQTSLRVIIYDVLGRKWVNEDVRSGNTSIDVSNLVNGVYEVVVVDNSGAALLEQKVVKQ